MTVYFMGVWPSDRGEVGHYCVSPIGARMRQGLLTPWAGSYDPLGDDTATKAGWGEAPSWSREYAQHPCRVQPEGIGRVVVDRGWTLLTCWDRSGDKRKGSHASFAFSAVLTPDEAVAKARELFPEVWKRIDAHLEKQGIVFRGEARPW